MNGPLIHTEPRSFHALRGMIAGTLLRPARGAERQKKHSHAERGNE